MEPCDHGSYVLCAARELTEEAHLPDAWHTAFATAAGSCPTGHRLLRVVHPTTGQIHTMAHWFIQVDSPALPALTAAGLREAEPGSLQWRDASNVIGNLQRYRFHAHLAEALRRRQAHT